MAHGATKGEHAVSRCTGAQVGPNKCFGVVALVKAGAQQCLVNVLR
jgi:hypothetical protein